ncbi:MAG: NADH-quinone oxidoreductase subunit K [Candidatus Brocadiia bacterium]
MNDIILSVVILTDLALLGTSRLAYSISLLAFQGIIVGLLPVSFGHQLTIRTALMAIMIIIIKGGVFPKILTNALREVNIRHESEPYIGYVASSFAGIVLLGISFWLGATMPIPTAVAGTNIVIPASIFTILTGLFLIISRKNAVTLVIGYLTIENGIAAFGLAMVSGIPFLIELGILLDAFTAVFVMAIIIYHINLEFNTIDSDHLSSLKG